MERLSYGFVLGYHGCDREIGESLINGARFKASDNDFDWLGPGVYFWEANPVRGIEYAAESMKRKGSKIKEPFVVGAVIDLGICLDLTTSLGIQIVKRGFESLSRLNEEARTPMPANTADRLRRRLDCAVVRRVHAIFEEEKFAPFDSIRGSLQKATQPMWARAFRKKRISRSQ